MKKICLSLMATLLVHAIVAQTYHELVTQGFTFMEQDSLKQAEACFREAIEKEPSNKRNVLLFSNIGTLQRKQGRLPEAIETYSLALNYSPLAIPVLLSRASAYMELAHYDKAYTDYCNVLDQEADNTEALFFRAYVYVNRHDYQMARADYLRLLQLEPDHANGCLGLAVLNQKEGRLQEANEQLSQLIEKYPTNVTYYAARADVLAEQTFFDLALLDYEKVLELNPEDAYTYVARAEVLLQLKKKTQAHADLEKAVSLGVPKLSLSHLYNRCK